MTETEQAKAVLADICATLKELKYPYLKAEKQGFVAYRSDETECIRDDSVIAGAEQGMLLFMAELDIKIPERMLYDAALAVNLLNESIVFGAFDLDVENRKLYFRATHGYAGCRLGKALLEQMVKGVERTVAAFGVPLKDLMEEKITMEQFVELLSL